MIDVVIKLTWNYTIFCELFKKRDDCREAREAHPQFFLTLYDTLLCSFFVTVAVLFHGKNEKATSLYNLIKDTEESKPELAKRLNKEISANESNIKKIGILRNQVCAHRWEAKTPQEVFGEVSIQLKALKQVVDLAQLVVYALAEEAGGNRKHTLEKLQLNEETIQFIADDAERVMQAFLKTV